MMRSDAILRPTYTLGDSFRISGKTLDLARQHLALIRVAHKLDNKKLFFLKGWRRKRLSKRVLKKHAEASELWRELYLRFRPLISVVMVRGGVKYGSKEERTEAVNLLVRTLERTIEASPSSWCFAELLWNALREIVGPSKDQILTDLHESFHVLPVLDELNDPAQGIIKMGYYYRSEMMAGGGNHAPLSDLELDELDAACNRLGLFMLQMGTELDRISCNVLKNKQLVAGTPSETVKRWLGLN